MAFTTSFPRDVKSVNGTIRKRIKTSDLPLTSATRAAIEGLAHTFKKKGGYDNLRHEIWQDLERSEFETEFTSSLLKVAEEELDKNTEQLLKLDRGKATLLIEGAVDRAGVYQSAEAQIDSLIDAHIGGIETGIRSLRRKDIGDEGASAEHWRGSKTDEQYAEEAASKRAAREKVREEAREKDRAIAEERKRRRKEEEVRLEKEQTRRREEREARKREEREQEEEREREREKERERQREKEREKERERDRDRMRARHSERDRERMRDSDRHRGGDRERERDSDRRESGRRTRYDDESRRRDKSREPSEALSKGALSQDDHERLEQEALYDLLKEGKKVARRSRHQLELDVDETLTPPPRKTAPASAINPIARSSDARKNASTWIKTEDTGSKTPLSETPEGSESARKDRGRSPTYDQASFRRSSRHSDRRRHDSRDRYDRHSKRDYSRERRRHDSRDRYDRRRRDSSARDTRRRGSSHHDDRVRSQSRDRRRTYRSRSRSRDRIKRSTPPPSPRDRGAHEAWKQEGVKKREAEAKAYLAAQKEARDNGHPVPGWAEYMASLSKKSVDEKGESSVSARIREPSHEKAPRARSRSRSRTRQRGSRIERSTSPANIDRYVPSSGFARDRRGSTTARSPVSKAAGSRHHDREDRRHRVRSRSRSRDRTRRSYRSRSRSRSRSRDRRRDYRSSKDDHQTRRRSRDGKSRYRSRSRSRSRDRRRERSMSSEPSWDRDRRRDRARNHSRSRSPRRERHSRRDQ